MPAMLAALAVTPLVSAQMSAGVAAPSAQDTAFVVKHRLAL